MPFIIFEKLLFLILIVRSQFQRKRGEMAKGEKCDICAAGTDFLKFFLCGTYGFFCSEILPWASPDPMGGGEGGVSWQPFSSQEACAAASFIFFTDDCTLL